jgi:hypothetical protein
VPRLSGEAVVDNSYRLVQTIRLGLARYGVRQKEDMTGGWIVLIDQNLSLNLMRK